MAVVSTVEVDNPADGPFLVRWPQPYTPGQLGSATDWFVTTGAVERRVQRNTLTDEVEFCTVLVAAGTTSFTVDTGLLAGLADQWTEPTLTGLLLQFTGQDGSTLEAAMDGTDADNVDDVLRTGPWCHQIRRWCHARTTDVGAGDLAVGDQVLGVHAYLSYRGDFPGIVELDVRISNASATVNTNGLGLGSDWFGHVFLDGCTLVLPAGWTAVSLRPIHQAGTGHMFPTKMATVYRAVLYHSSETNGAAKAADVLALKGLGRAVSGSSYRSVPSYLAQKTLQPDLDLVDYDTTGYAAAKTHYATTYSTLATAANAGTTAADGENNVVSVRLGFFHSVGQADPQSTGGKDIETHPGFGQVREAMQWHRLRADMKCDSSGLFLYNRATGAPLRTRDFAVAYTDRFNGFGGYSQDAIYLGRQPFSFFIQNNQGYEFNVKDTSHFYRWFPNIWPPCFLDTRTYYPDGVTRNLSYDKYVPYAAPWPLPPHTLNDGTCAYRESLIAEWQPHSNPAWAAENYFDGLSLCHRDPDDGQHLTRITVDLRACAYQIGDLVAIDTLDMVAEWCGLAWSEAGHVPYTYYAPYNDRHLLYKEEQVDAFPYSGESFCGREAAWVGDAFATQYALSSPAKRISGYPRYGIQRRCELMHKVLEKTTMFNPTTGQYTGVTGRSDQSDAFAAGTGGFTGPPIPPGYLAFQVGLETPLVMHALFALSKQLYLTEATASRILSMAVNHVGQTQLYTDYLGDTNQMGPMKWVGGWHNATGPTDPLVAPRAFIGSGNPGTPNHYAAIEYAYRLTGDSVWIAVANALGNDSPGATGLERANLLVNRSSVPPFGGGLIAYLAGQGTFPGPGGGEEERDPAYPELLSDYQEAQKATLNPSGADHPGPGGYGPLMGSRNRWGSGGNKRKRRKPPWSR